MRGWFDSRWRGQRKGVRHNSNGIDLCLERRLGFAEVWLWRVSLQRSWRESWVLCWTLRLWLHAASASLLCAKMSPVGFAYSNERCCATYQNKEYYPTHNGRRALGFRRLGRGLVRWTAFSILDTIFSSVMLRIIVRKFIHFVRFLGWLRHSRQGSHKVRVCAKRPMQKDNGPDKVSQTERTVDWSFPNLERTYGKYVFANCLH